MVLGFPGGVGPWGCPELLGFITRSIKSRSAEVILKLYLALVRPHLDYAVQFWSPYYRMDIILLESVQTLLRDSDHL